ncbi:hypothetical protein ACOMHN_001454 [Nucella lapillus]
MMWKFLVVLCVLGAVCLMVDARRREGNRGGNRRGGGRRGGRRGIPDDAANVTHWVRTLPGGAAQAQESAYSLGNRVFVLSKDKRQLKLAGFKSSLTIYDFTGASPVRLLKVKNCCYLMEIPEDITKEWLLSTTNTYNGQTRAEDAMVQLFASELTPEQSSMLQSHANLTALCHSRKPVRALSTVEPADFGANRKTVMGSTLESFVTVTKEAGRGRQGRGNRRKGGRRGGRGEGK